MKVNTLTYVFTCRPLSVWATLGEACPELLTARDLHLDPVLGSWSPARNDCPSEAMQSPPTSSLGGLLPFFVPPLSGYTHTHRSPRLPQPPCTRPCRGITVLISIKQGSARVCQRAFFLTSPLDQTTFQVTTWHPFSWFICDSSMETSLWFPPTYRHTSWPSTFALPIPSVYNTLKLQYFGHLMWRTDPLEKTLMLGKTEGRKRRGWQTLVWASSWSWW